MSDFWAEFCSRQSVFGLGLGLCLVGIVLWVLPRRFRRIFDMRRSYTEWLRAAGEEERAYKIDIETDRLAKRLPLYGRIMMLTGAFVLLSVWLSRR